MEEKPFKRRKWLFWLLFITFLLLNIWVWSSIFSPKQAKPDLEHKEIDQSV